MPETKGPTRRSSNCGENFLRTKAATDSSPTGGVLFPRMSRTRALFVGPSISELMKNAGGLSGTGRSSPSIRTNRGARGGACSSSFEMPSSAQSSRSAGVPLKLCGPNSKRKPSRATELITPPGRGDVSILGGSESLRKKRLGDELLFFKIRVENHGQIADEDAAEPGSADFAAIEEHEAILAGWLQAAKLFREMLVKIDAEFA